MHTERLRLPPSDSANGPSSDAGSLRTPSVAAPSLAVLIVLALGFRLAALFLLRYGSSVPDWSDFRYYHELAGLSAQGYYPDVQFWVEYPPLFPWLAVGAYKLSQQLPGLVHPYFWFDLILTIVLGAADAGAIVVIDRLGDAFWGRPAGRRSATIYAAMFLPAFAILGWFDTLPTFFLLLALDLMVVGPARTRGSGLGWAAAAGAAIGVGVMLKLFPVLALPAATVLEGHDSRSMKAGKENRGGANSNDGVGRTDGRRGGFAVPGRLAGRVVGAESLLRPAVTAGVAAATVAIIALPFLLQSRDTFLATFRNVLARGSWMSPWAILDNYYGTGTVAALHDRLFYNASALWGTPARDPALWWIALAIGAALYLWRWRIAARERTPRSAIALTGFGVCLLLLLSRGFSQQFTLWLLPFIALVLPGVDGALIVVLLTLNDIVLEGYVYVTLFPTLHQLLWLTAAVRSVLLIWLAFELAMAIDPAGQSRFWRIRGRVAAPAFLFAGAALVVASALIAPRVEAAMLARTGDGPAIEAIRKTSPTTALVFTQPDSFDMMSAYAKPRTSLLLAEPGLLTWTGDRSLYHRLETGLAGRSTVALVTDTTQPAPSVLPAVRSWLEARYGKAPPIKAGSIVIEEYALDRLAAEQPLNVQFGDSILLAGYRPARLAGRPGTPLAVTLDWRAARSIDRDYTVSLQLLDFQGKLVAQHDSMPVNNTLPTSSWRPGQVVADEIDLPLPANLKTGDYQLIVVLYDHQTLQRLPARSGSQASDHAVVAMVPVSGTR